MENKIIRILAILLATIMVIMPFVSAGPYTESELGLTEDVSGGKIIMTQVRLWFTFNQEDKISGEINLARLRLIQAKIAAKNGDSKAVENAITSHETNMERVKEKMNDLGSSENTQDLNKYAAKLVRLENVVSAHEKRINYIGEVIETSNLSESQKVQVMAQVQSMEKNMGELKNLQERKTDSLRIRIQVAQGITSEEANKVIYQESNGDGKESSNIDSEESGKTDDAGNKR